MRSGRKSGQRPHQAGPHKLHEGFGSLEKLLEVILGEFMVTFYVLR